jgi:two-component system CheB/CheR fusion protein
MPMSPDVPDEDGLPSSAEGTLPAPRGGLPVVGVGASAGGVGALQTFFRHMPADSGMAFVVVLHLSPQYESQLAEVLQQTTAMPVLQVTEAMPLDHDRVYVIPPAKQLALHEGVLQLSDPVEPRGQRAPIDLFFRSLAESQGPRAAAIVLSGTGADGAMGAQRVKEHGGFVLAQDPAEAEYGMMPRHAIATGLVDCVLPVAELPGALVAYWQRAEALTLPSAGPPGGADEGESLRELLALLLARTSHDFSQYKRSTVLRRIGRRMQVTGAPTLSTYLALLRGNPEESAALLRDLLISVTNFFRDPPAWQALAAAIPGLFRGKQADDAVRVWVAGCATGEEAYSIAMLLVEHRATLERPPQIQIFATDIDERAVAVARQGLYPETIAVDVSEERLQRFFSSEPGQYRVRKELRELVLFAPHNLLRDPPFARLDLITCRNLLIYLTRPIQAQILQLFHFILQPDRLLLLGSSESTDAAPTLFEPLNRGQRIFRRRAAPSAAQYAPQLPLVSAPRRQIVVDTQAGEHGPPSFEQIAAHALLQYGPPNILINDAYEIVHLDRGAGRFLQFADGAPSPNLLKAVHPELRLELRDALDLALEGGLRTEMRPVRLLIAGAPHIVSIVVQPLVEPAWAHGFFLVLFNEMPDSGDPPLGTFGDAEPLVRQLEQELQRTKEQLRAAIEQYDAALEAHKASNEELQAINEELRVATEELEASKEELQSINEELLTVNQELKHKVEEVSHVNSDLQNLMASTAIGTIFVDRELRIKRYTPSAQAIVNLLPGDLNRPLAHLTHILAYDQLAPDAARVLATLTPVEREVGSADGRWYLLRIQPYRTETDYIDGVVLTFVDVSQLRQAQRALRTSQERLRLLIDSVQDYAILTVTTDNRVAYWNAGAERMFGYREAEIIGQDAALLFTPEDRAANVPALELQQALLKGRAEDERWHIRKDGSRFFASGVMTPMENPGLRGFAKVARDLTDRKRAEEALRRAHDELEQRVEERTQQLTVANAKLQAEAERRAHLERARQEVLRQLVTAQEDERQRIARELHDELGQQLVGLRLGLDSLLQASADPAQLPARVQNLQKLIGQIDDDVERLALELRPSVLDNLGLIAALQQYVADWSAHHELHAEFAAVGSTTRLVPVVEIVLYRAVQEALTNVLKHAGAYEVSVVLKQLPDHVQLIVEDDGRGFVIDGTAEEHAAARHLGLLGMRERVALVGGSFAIESVPGQGTTIFVRIPLPLAPQEDT